MKPILSAAAANPETRDEKAVCLALLIRSVDKKRASVETSPLPSS
jgi:hypothetical protein